jgi:hypothetical protein
MADAVTYLSTILNDGKLAIGQGLVQAKRLKPYNFVVGNAYNFTPTEDATVPSGDIVFTGTKSLIAGSILTKDTFRFSLTLPETAGDFDVGNIMLYVQSDDGTIFPFIWVVSKIPYPKKAVQGTNVGDRYVFNFIEKIINANDILAITVQNPALASLAGYRTELELPSPSQALFQQFYVQEPLYSPVPFIGARRSIDNSYWGMPLYSRLGDPFFGVLDSGRAGERISTTKMYWGGRLSMKPEALKINYGGGLLTDTPTRSIGGLPLGDNPGYVLDT